METTVATTVARGIIDSAGDVLGVAGTVANTIIGNPVLILFLAGSVAGLAIWVFRKLKG